MRNALRSALGVGLGFICGCSAQSDPAEVGPLRVDVPELYPALREATPSALIADAELAGTGDTSGESSTMATSIRERFYAEGPTAILRIVQGLDERMGALDTDLHRHDCLTMEPVAVSYALPGEQTLDVKLQCVTEPVGTSWLAFGFAQPLQPASEDEDEASDADVLEPNDFYLVDGRIAGRGGVYHLDRDGNVDAWIAVADQATPEDGQVLMHLLTSRSAGTLELALAGSGVGFCGAHLKADADHVFVTGKPDAASDASEQSCQALSAGCYALGELDVDLGADSSSCTEIAAPAFAMSVGLDASDDDAANVDPALIYDYFNDRPLGVPSF
jgi:hypothetical protein